MKTLNSYTVTVEVDNNETIYEASYVNDYDNSNLAIKGALDVLAKMNEDKYVGILVVRQPVNFYDNGKAECVDKLYNTYNHISNDKTNWVTVKEAKKALMSIRA